MLRLRVAEYFDSVIDEIDLFTETKIQSIKTQTEEDWWNKRRQEQIDEVRRIERACLDHVNTLKMEEKEIESGEWKKRVFVEYCFTVEFDGLVYLAKANRHVEPKEKRFLYVHLNKKKYVKVAINIHQSLGMTIEEFEVSLRDYFLTDTPVIDISSGIDQCFSIKKAHISDPYGTKTSGIDIAFGDLTIQECSLYFFIQNTAEENRALDVIKCLMARRNHINTITIDLKYFDRLDPSPEIKALAQSVELNDPVKFNFKKMFARFQDFCLSSVLEKYITYLFVMVTNWQFISVILFDGVSLEDLEKADLSFLHSLTSLYLKLSSTEKSSSDWMFLDVCRASLEQFELNFYQRSLPLSISCRTFRGMTNLKSLHFSGSFSVDSDSQDELFADLTRLEKLDIDCCDCTTPFPLSRKTFCTMTNLQELELRGSFSIESKNQEELFTNLIHLKKLDLSLDQMLTTRWIIYSSTVKELRLSFVKLPKIASSQIRFKLPQLASLKLSFYCDRIECDLTDMMSCFSHVKKLEIYSRCFEIMTKGWFHRLTSVKELDLNLQSTGYINSQLFEGFGHLTKLRIYICPENILDRCTLHKLIHLETIAFVGSNVKSLDQVDKSIFDGLNSLRTIEYSVSNLRSRAYVYFENLDRILLVIT